MGDDITIGVTEIVNNIEVTAQPNDQIVDISVIDNTDEVTLNITPTVIEINVNKGSSYAKWGTILGTLSDQEDLQDALDLKADLVDGKVPSSQLPSYVDDVIEVANYAALPATGESGKIYITIDNNHIFRWTGSIYVEITDNTAVWGAITGTLSSQTDLVNALNLRVPYTGATGNINLGEYGLTAGFLGLDTTPTSTPTGVGTIFWDSANRTAALIDGDGDTTLQIGQEQRILVHNNTGSTLTDGQVVYVTGSTGNLPSVSLANATSETTSAATIGVVTESIAHGADGFITTSGIINGLNTLDFDEGDLLWLSTTAGAFTTTKPTSPAHLVLIGYVIKKAGGNGSILVKIQNTQELSESSDVLFTSLTDKDVLTYESSSQLWKNKSISTILGYTPANDSSVVHKTGDETISGRKTFNSTTDIGIRSNISGNGYGIYSENSSNGISFYVANNGSGKAFSVSNTLGSFGNMYEGSYNGTSNFAVNYLGEITGTKFIKSGGTSSQFLKADGSVDTNTYLQSVAATLPLGSTGGTSPVISITQATTSSNGYLSSTDWNTFNGKQSALSGTGFVKISGTTISYDNSTYVPTSRTLTINGTAYDLSADRSWTISAGISGSGTTNYLPKFTGSTALGNSLIYDNGTNVIIGQSTNSGLGNVKLLVKQSGALDYEGLSVLSSTNDDFISVSHTGSIARISSSYGNTGGYTPLAFATSGIDRLYITTGGNIGIGTTSPSFQLQLSNDSAAKPGSPLWTVSSDIRIKENVRPYTDGLEKLMQVNPVYYDYNGKAGFSITKDNVGIIAQEMQEVLPNTIKTFKAKLNDDDEEETELLSFNANEIIYVLINSVKELKAEIEILKNK